MSDEQQQSTEPSMNDTAADAWETSFAGVNDEAPPLPEPKLRDESGKFAKADSGEEVTTPDAAPAEETTAAPATPSVQWDEGLRRDAPDSWSPEARALWDNLPEQARLEIRRREAHIGKYSEHANLGNEFQRAIAPHMENIRQSGVSPAQAAAELFAFEAALRNGSPEQRAQIIHGLARSYGIPLQQGEGGEQADPAYSALQQELQQIKQALTQQQREQHRQAMEAAAAEIEAFRADPKNKHFDIVYKDMGNLLTAGIAKDLADAYKRACAMNTDIYTMEIEEWVKAKREEEERKAREAKQAASVNIPKRGTVQTAGPRKTELETAADAYDRFMVR